jgi:hypothetical protein
MKMLTTMLDILLKPIDLLGWLIDIVLLKPFGLFMSGVERVLGTDQLSNPRPCQRASEYRHPSEWNDHF